MDIILYYPAGTRWWRCRGHHGNAMRMPWQHHSNCGLICSLVVWYSPDLLQWHGRQIHTSVTSVIVTLFINYFINQLIDHHHQQSVKRSKNTVSTGLCFLLSERHTEGWADLKKKKWPKKKKKQRSMDGLINKGMWSPCDKTLKEERWANVRSLLMKTRRKNCRGEQEKEKETADCVRETYWCVKAVSVKK